jgi:hypothetical protein
MGHRSGSNFPGLPRRLAHGPQAVSQTSSPIGLDRLVLGVRDPAQSVRFNHDVLGFGHERRIGPFELLRVNEGLTLDFSDRERHNLKIRAC